MLPEVKACSSWEDRGILAIPSGWLEVNRVWSGKGKSLQLHNGVKVLEKSYFWHSEDFSAYFLSKSWMLVAPPASTTEPPEMQPHMSRPWIKMRLHSKIGPIIVQFAPRRQIPAHGISCAAFVSEPSSSGYSMIPWLRKIPCTPWRRKNGIYKWHSQQFSVENSTCGSRYNF